MGRSHWRSLVTLGLRIALVIAQTSSGVCDSNHQWMSNSMGQTPCVVAASLEKPCVSGSYNLPSLNYSAAYEPPQAENANVCTCNPVVYNLISACSVCQGGEVGSWKDWTTYCPSDVTNQNGYPLQVPPATAIPSWAETPPSNSSGYFSASNAFSTGANSNAGKKKMGTFALVALILGVVGGLVVLAILALLFYQRRQRRLGGPASRDIRNSHPLMPQSRGYAGLSADDFEDDLKDPIRRSFARNSMMSINSPKSSGHATLYDLPYEYPSSSGHDNNNSPAKTRPLSLHSVTYPVYPIPPPRDAYDPPSPGARSEGESLAPDDSISQAPERADEEFVPPVYRPPQSVSQRQDFSSQVSSRRYDGIIKLERLAPQRSSR